MTTAQLFLGCFLLTLTLIAIFVICRAAALSEKAQEQALRDHPNPTPSNDLPPRDLSPTGHDQP